MKFLLLLLVIGGAIAWFAFGRRSGRGNDAPPQSPPSPPSPPAKPQAMLSCAHCGVHLPAADALRDAAGRAFCSEAHRLAGPRSGD